MNINPFKLERYFARYEFSAPYLLCSSDCEALSLQKLLELANSQTLELWNKLSLGYTESQGLPLLREEIAAGYQHIEPQDIMVMVPEEGIFIAMNTVLKKGDHVVTTFPAYQSLYEVASALGCTVSHWLPQQTKQGWQFKIEDLQSLITPETRLLVVNFPHNPTGALADQDTYRQIVELAREHDLFLFSDEMYHGLEYDPADRLTPACDLYEKAITLSGMSKTYALAGLRIGWLATQNPDLFCAFVNFKDYTTICNSAPSEILALIALQAKETLIARSLKIINSNLALLDDFFARHEDTFSWQRPRAGSIAFPGLTNGQAVADFCLDLVEKQGVMLLPADVYDFPGNYFRLGFGRKNMPQALQRLEDYLAA